ncbi:MAG: RecB-like helicase [Campylobacter sp.]|nr:RecB-like helicase [Campylobacter sp.]
MIKMKTKKGEDARYLALEASAGSGKTFSLAVRFVGLVLLGENINEILALTFTKKAAAEMKVRIIDTFSLLHTPQKEAELDALCVLLSKEKEEILRLRDEHLAKFMDCALNISTFDAFFGKILRAFALNAGINPNFQNDDNILKAQNDAFIKEAFKNDELSGKMYEYINDANLSKQAFFGGISELWKNGISADISQSKAPNLDEINEILARMHEILVRNKASDKQLNFMTQTNNISELSGRSWFDKPSLDYRTFAKAFSLDLDDEFVNLKRAMLEYAIKFENYQISSLAKFLNFYSQNKKELSKKSAKMTFSDVSVGVHELFCKTGEIGEHNDLLYFRLDSKIKHLLIDEFQDTSVLQYEIMLPLIDEIVAGLGQSGLGSLFYVGDKKQSIYKFRGAKKELFDSLKDRHNQIVLETMPKNYRSLKLLVRFVNAIFGDLEINEETGEKYDYKPQEANKFNESKFSAEVLDKILKFPKENKNLSFFTPDDDDFGYICAKTYEDVCEGAVSEAIRLIKEHSVSPSDIAILCWTNKDVAKIQELLSLKNIPSSTGATKKLIATPQVKAISEYAKYLISKDEIHALNIKSLLNLSDKPDFSPVSLSDEAVSVSKTIAENLGLNFGDENLLIFFEILQKYDSFVQYLFADDNSDAYAKELSGVKIMTVHKSKGLEFAHVILCDLLSKGGGERDKFMLGYDGQWRIKYRMTNREIYDAEYAKFKKDSENLERAEVFNKLYVGFTRAEKSLIIVKKGGVLNGNNPSYFTPYTSNKVDKKFLEIEDFEYGYIIPSSVTPVLVQKPKKINLQPVAKQNITEYERASDRAVVAEFSKVYKGEALHYTLEMLDDFEISSLESALNLAKNRYAKYLDSSDFDEIRQKVESLCANEEFLSYISGCEIYKEISIKRENGGVSRVDLMCVKNDEILLFDYKSSPYFLEKNKKQIQSYKAYLISSSNNPNLSVRTFIVVLENSVKIEEVKE